MERKKRKRCPFCGGMTSLNGQVVNFVYKKYRECKHCGAQGPKKDTFKEANESWDERKNA